MDGIAIFTAVSHQPSEDSGSSEADSSDEFTSPHNQVRARDSGLRQSFLTFRDGSVLNSSNDSEAKRRVDNSPSPSYFRIGGNRGS